MNKYPINKLVRIAVFYDGSYFFNVSKYYRYVHKIQSWLQFTGLHDFIECNVSQAEGLSRGLCRVVDAHYFRGRFYADDAEKGGFLKSDRIADDILMAADIVTHYRPISHTGNEKGIDVWFALEAYELAALKGYDVLVLITGDEDHVPLVRKLHTLGTKVMLLYWQLKYEKPDVNGNLRSETIFTSNNLIQEVSFPVDMQKAIDSPDGTCSVGVAGMFGS
jgi:hypothetical protein